MKKWRLPERKRDVLAAAGFIGVAVLLVWAAIFAWHHFIETPPYIDPQRYPVNGVDISAHNGNVDFNRLHEAGIQFAFIKASEGKDFRDSLFAKNYTNAKRAGVKVGAYHFFRFDRDGIDQARNAIAAVGGRKLDLGIAIDVEDHNNAPGVDSTLIAQRLTTMADFLNLVGYRVTFYSNVEGFERYLAPNVPGATLWICSFSQTPVPAEWTFWQYNHRGQLPGVKGDVDLNVFCGNEREWLSFLDGAPYPY